MIAMIGTILLLLLLLQAIGCVGWQKLVKSFFFFFFFCLRRSLAALVQHRIGASAIGSIGVRTGD